MIKNKIWLYCITMSTNYAIYFKSSEKTKKKDLIEKAKELAYGGDDTLTLCSRQEKSEWKEVANSVCEIEDSPLKDLILCFHLPSELPIFWHGGKNMAKLRNYIETKANAKLVSQYEYEEFRKRLSETEKIPKYDKMLNRIKKLADEDFSL